jgi:hypothetical protein
MLRIIILIFLIVCIRNVQAQGNFEIDILNFEKEIYAQKNDTLKQDLILKKIDVLLSNNILNERTFKEVKRIQTSYLDSSKSSKFFWNAALVSFLNKETNYANSYLKRFANFQGSESTSYKLLFFLNNQKIDSAQCAVFYMDLCKKDSIFMNLSKVIELEDFELKHKKFLLNSGLVIPGSGAIFNGNIVKGFTSLGLNTISFMAIRELVFEQMYVNAIGWGFNLFSKFYLGNLRMTEGLVEKKEQLKKNKLTSDCELILNDIFKKYPFEFKK